jgi:hypothetical protein
MNYPDIVNLFRCADTARPENPSHANESLNAPLAKEASKPDSFLVNSQFALRLDELI